jgi:predicted DNA-binding protein (MmcQ/YjbR family)
MTFEVLQAICRKFNQVTEDVKWEQDYCFNVCGKMFLVVGFDKVPVSASFKVEDEVFDEMTEREGFKPAPYLARRKWVYLDDIGRLGKKEWEQRIATAYGLVAAKIPKKKK